MMMPKTVEAALVVLLAPAAAARMRVAFTKEGEAEGERMSEEVREADRRGGGREGRGKSETPILLTAGRDVPVGVGVEVGEDVAVGVSPGVTLGVGVALGPMEGWEE